MKFNFLKSLKNDYLLFIFFGEIIVVCGFFLFASFGPGEYRFINFDRFINKVNINNGLLNYFKNDGYLGDIIVGIVLVVLAIISIILFLIRLAYIKSFNNECETVNAVVKNIKHFRGTCGVDLEFSFNDNVCKKHFALMNNSTTRHIKIDSEVKLLIKNENPKKSLMCDYYFD